MPPVQPMLAKSVKGIPDPAKYGGLSFEPKWDGFRCIVFRDGDEVELDQPEHEAADPLLPRGGRRGPRAAAGAVRARRRAVRGDRREARVRDPPGADPPGQVADRHAGREDAGGVRGVRPARAGRRVVRRPPVRGAARGDRGGARRTDRPLLPHPHHDRPRRGRGLVPPVRGRRPGRRGRQAARPRRTSRTPARCSRSSTSAPPTWWSRATASTRRRPPSGRCWAPSCSACTPTGSCSTSGSRPASPRSAGPS